MIIIDILNSEQVAENNAGKFKIKISKTFRVNLKQRVEKNMPRKLKEELVENGLEAHVWVED